MGTLKLLSALGCGLMAGVFFAFSTFVMNALEHLPPAQGISAMQRINVSVINPLFLTVFLGTAAACALLAGSSLLKLREPGAGYVLTGSVLYLAGTVLVTLACNVPRNDALAAVDPASLEGARLWAQYVVGWTAWNHVRGAAALLAAALLVIGSRVP